MDTMDSRKSTDGHSASHSKGDIASIRAFSAEKATKKVGKNRQSSSSSSISGKERKANYQPDISTIKSEADSKAESIKSFHTKRRAVRNTSVGKFIGGKIDSKVHVHETKTITKKELNGITSEATDVFPKDNTSSTTKLAKSSKSYY